MPDTAGRTAPARRRLFVAILLTGSLLFGAIVLEIGLRLVWHNSYADASTEQFVRVRLQPRNRHYRIDRRGIDAETPTTDLRTNDRSYILPLVHETEYETTIAFLGGSTTECSAVAEDARFPAVAGAALGERGVRARILNAGRSGNTTQDSLLMLLSHVVQDRPDVAVLMHAVNDVGMLDRLGDYTARVARPLRFSDWLTDAKQVASRASYVVGFARMVLAARQARPQLRDDHHTNFSDEARAARIPFDLYRQRIDAFVAQCRAFGIRPVLMTQALVTRPMELTPGWANRGAQSVANRIVRERGQALGVPVIDLDAFVKTLPDWETSGVVFYDGLHFNDAGSRAVGEHIAGALLPVLRAPAPVGAPAPDAAPAGSEQGVDEGRRGAAADEHEPAEDEDHDGDRQ